MIVLHDSLEHDSLAKEGNDPLVLLMLPLLNILEFYQSSCCSAVLNTALYSAC